MPNDFYDEDEFIDDYFEEEEEGSFTCWSEAEGGCNLVHPLLSESAGCSIVHKAQILEVIENNIMKYWTMASEYEDFLLVSATTTDYFELSDEETEYLVTLEML